MKIQPIKKIQKILKVTNKNIKRCPMCEQIFVGKYEIVCPACSWEDKS
jgi:hypothetical protein